MIPEPKSFEPACFLKRYASCNRFNGCVSEYMPHHEFTGMYIRHIYPFYYNKLPTSTRRSIAHHVPADKM